MLTQARLKELLHYDPETGKFTRATSSGTAKVGDIAGCVRADGYVLISLDGRLYYGHRLAWLYVHGTMPEAVDHRSGAPSDNRIINLRSATQAQNMRNRRPSSRNTSGVKGVTWISARSRWRAQIKQNGVYRSLGEFKSFDDAVAARASAESTHHGEFTWQPQFN